MRTADHSMIMVFSPAGLERLHSEGVFPECLGSAAWWKAQQNLAPDCVMIGPLGYNKPL